MYEVGVGTAPQFSLTRGDCFELMPKLSDASYELIVTDPPYGMDLTPQRAGGAFKGVKIANDADLGWTDDFFAECFRVLPRKDCGAFFFCSHHSVGPFIESGKRAGFTVKNLLVWNKDWFGMGGNWRPNFELILLLTKGRFVTHSNNLTNILTYRRLSPAKMVHPTEKPVALLRELIREPDYNPGSVLDPFMGSGATGEAAILEGRNFKGIEIDRDYFDIAVRRIFDNRAATIVTTREVAYAGNT